MKKYRESFLPLSQPSGHAQVDFGKFKYYYGFQNPKKGYALILSFLNSNAGWIQVFKSEKGYALILSFPNSNAGWIQVFKCEKRLRTDFVFSELECRLDSSF
ncbi:hypothetical protein FACS189499_08470 [Clostridia bacterium]|nr:hypothetical protein FACS189499_08470 [Clostridia bacterium]